MVRRTINDLLPLQEEGRVDQDHESFRPLLFHRCEAGIEIRRPARCDELKSHIRPVGPRLFHFLDRCIAERSRAPQNRGAAEGGDASGSRDASTARQLGMVHRLGPAARAAKHVPRRRLA